MLSIISYCIFKSFYTKKNFTFDLICEIIIMALQRVNFNIVTLKHFGVRMN
jgi:hypothetical protein